MNSVSGIYLILNTRNGKVYIGKATNFKARWRRHKSDLNRNSHKNKHLQNAWNKYGEKTFQFKILEHCTVDQLNERETHHIKIYRARGLAYNQKDGGEGGENPSEETRRKLSESNKLRPSFSAETRKRMSESQKGHQVTNETRYKIGSALADDWLVIDPSGIEYQISSLSEFCKQNKLSRFNMWAVSKGKQKHHKGWKCRKLT